MKKGGLKRVISGIAALVLFAGVVPAQAAGGMDYKPVIAGAEKVNGFYNGETGIDVTLIAGYNAGMMSADGGSSEIVEYNSASQTFYAVNGVKGTLDVISVAGLAEGEQVQTLGDMENRSNNEIDMKALLEEEAKADPLVTDFLYGDMTSIALNSAGSLAAVALQDERSGETGRVALFSCREDGGLTFLKLFETGVQPDMVTFTPDGKTIVTADEGEPREGAASDPKGSVTIIDAEKQEKRSTVYFDRFDREEARALLCRSGVVLRKDTAPSVDLEPEYIVVSADSKTAYVALQEANAIAVLDLTGGEFKKIFSLGLQDFGTSPVDMLKDGSINIEEQPGVYGLKMPDGISIYETGGKTYLLTANEGDSRADWPGMDNEAEGKTSPTGSVTVSSDVVWFDASQYDGLDQSKAYLFGGRSFSLYEVTEEGLRLQFDSGSDFEQITAAQLPEFFNCSNDKLKLDNRSGKKGPEPETVTVGTVDGRTCAFVAIERIGGIMVYDITDPEEVSFSNYINSRDFEVPIQGDVSPEGLCFVPAADSPTGDALLLAACEVSGTVAAYKVKKTEPVRKPLKLAVISDTHLYDARLGVSGSAFESYLANDRKMIAESELIVDEALKQIGESDADVVLIAGDLTKDGEKQNHLLLAGKLAELEKKGKSVYVINGNHDLSNAYAVSFSGETTTRVETINRDEFRSIYEQFGYGEALAKDNGSLSYTADLDENYRLIVIDSCIYNNDKENPSQETGGRISAASMDWIKAQISSAIKDGKRPIGMMHHGLVPHAAIQPAFFPEYLAEDYAEVSAQLADAGLNLVFTGHFHSQDAAAVKTAAGRSLYDVETGSLLTAPVPIRYVSLTGADVSYTSRHLDSVAGLEDKGDFQKYAQSFLMSGLESMVPGMIAAAGQVDMAAAEVLAGQDVAGTGMTVKQYLSTCMALHYRGDEENDGARPQLAQIAAALMETTAESLGGGEQGAQMAALYKLLGSAAYALITDMGGPGTGSDIVVGDNAASFTLSALPNNSGGSGSGSSGNGGSSGSGSGSGSSGASTETTTTTDGGGFKTTTKVDSVTGTITTTITTREGVVTEAVEEKDGAVSASVTLPAGMKKAVVKIPIKAMKPGMTAVIVNSDGTRELVRKSAVGEDGILLTVNASVKLEIEDRSKAFGDTRDSWAADAVDFVTARELFSGTSETAFSPELPMTRGMLVTVLHNLESRPEAEQNVPFSDVGADAWYAGAVAWAAGNKLAAGNGNSFRPEETISREEIAVILFNYAKMSGISTEQRGDLSKFKDGNNISTWAEEAMGWAVAEGIFSGNAGGLLNAQNSATRAEVAAVMMNLAEIIVK